MNSLQSLGTLQLHGRWLCMGPWPIGLGPDSTLIKTRIRVMKKWTKPTVENRRLGFEINLYIQTR